MTDLQKAGLGKRIMAAIFDGILIATLAVGMAACFSFCFGYDAQVAQSEAIRVQYEQRYEIDSQIHPDNYQGTSEEDKAAYKERWSQADAALKQDAEYINLYSRMSSTRLMILSFSPLVAILLMELFIPLWFGNGQTLGKKIFGIGVMSIEGVRITGKQVFIRSVLGKYTIELMLPIYILVMTFTGGLGIVGLGLLAALGIAQIVCLVITRTNAPIHDIFASTVTVDFASQQIFEDIEDRDNYIKAKHAELAARADY